MNFTQWDFIKRYSRSKIIRRRRGKLVEKHQIEGLETGYSVEFSDRLRKTIALPKTLNTVPI
ncbi:MAG: hypothetical protein EWV60_07480 [Microcystis sp. Msp_OC_L_20101000_S702]|jgi:hypothetical protein|uniref:hypothetical protein n=1 Tax=Microcystis sp. Msp_OC_L_20101000_S702 TaxID=2486218 RepID=UPI00118EF120|nr:hypothetical protein [Microcystis sp. Msp_OC_L_20101000_S702]TRU11502.1 MAG: hypothetical protein EWV60_07480 [Microcystis sp. Msp_OC_L_20101000_S702]